MNRRRCLAAALGLGLLLPLAAVRAAGPEAGPVGVVVMHGKWDRPGGHAASFAHALEEAGFLMEAPEMPWSARRSYDTGTVGLEEEIGAVVARLKERGARTVFLAGHSFGAAGAVRYGSRHRVDGIIALAPGHYPEGKGAAEKTAASRAKAQDLAAAGKGGDTGWFDDFNTGGRLKALQMKASVYLDFFAPDGPMNFGANAAALPPDTAVLWVVGSGEEEQLRKLDRKAFDAISGSAKTWLDVPGGHMETPDNARSAAIAWIREAARQREEIKQ